MNARLAPAAHSAPRVPNRASRAFTLVELLVVIGIIAVLMSLLLPVMNKAREAARTTACMANLHQTYIAMRGYAAENKDSLPWGFIWEHVKQPVKNDSGWTAYKWSNGGNTGGRFLNWASLLSKYMHVNRPDAPLAGDYTPGATQDYYPTPYSLAFRCPSVDGTFSQSISYIVLPQAMPNWFEEMEAADSGSPARPLTAPAKFSDLYSDNTIAWDNAVWTKMGPDNPGNEYKNGGTIHGSFGNMAYSFIDNGNLDAHYADVTGTNRPLRFRDKLYDPYPRTKSLGQNFPILIPSRNSYSLANTDVSAEFITYGQSGAPRFRHNRETACNALIADGSVRTFSIKSITAKGNGPVYNTKNYVECDWLRKYIRIKSPD